MGKILFNFVEKFSQFKMTRGGEWGSNGRNPVGRGYPMRCNQNDVTDGSKLL